MKISELALEDGVKKIFLNVGGHNEDEVRPEFVDFFKYVKYTGTTYLESERMKLLNRWVKGVKEKELKLYIQNGICYNKMRAKVLGSFPHSRNILHIKERT